MKPIILASSSPRRRELLKMVAWPFEVKVPNITEIKGDQETVLEYIARNAREKCQAIGTNLPPDDKRSILAADTIVMFEGELLEKPVSNDHAFEMLTKLSGSSHLVQTAYHWSHFSENTRRQDQSEIVETVVSFRNLQKKEILDYIASGSPMDKSGSYGIQDDVGAGFVAEISGSYTNVVGLPLSQVIESYRAFSS